MKLFSAVLIFLLIVQASPVFAQNEDIVLNFSATEFNGKVLLSWSITQGNTCNGISIFRGSDTTSFVQISSIDGICGSTAETIKYQFTDLQPAVNASNYYRLSLGGIGYSYLVKVEVFDAGEQAYLLQPNPLMDESQLIFDNENQERIAITFFDQSGKFIRTLHTTEQMVTLRRADFGEGVYFFQLKSETKETTIEGKLLVI